MRFLVEKGANINKQDKENITALMFAVDKGHIEVAWWLQMITIMGDPVLSYSYGLFSSRRVTLS